MTEILLKIAFNQNHTKTVKVQNQKGHIPEIKNHYFLVPCLDPWTKVKIKKLIANIYLYTTCNHHDHSNHVLKEFMSHALNMN